MGIKDSFDLDGDGSVADEAGKGIFLVAAVAVVVVVLLSVWGSYARRTTETTVVLDKERVCSSDGEGKVSCKYLVYTERGTYAISDSIIAFRWNSSDVYGQIRRCHRYEITSFGWRQPALSTYPNIEKAVDLGRADECES